MRKEAGSRGTGSASGLYHEQDLPNPGDLTKTGGRGGDQTLNYVYVEAFARALDLMYI